MEKFIVGVIFGFMFGAIGFFCALNDHRCKVVVIKNTSPEWELQVNKKTVDTIYYYQEK